MIFAAPLSLRYAMLLRHYSFILRPYAIYFIVYFSPLFRLPLFFFFFFSMRAARILMPPPCRCFAPLLRRHADAYCRCAAAAISRCLR